jgi:hypothetical protein
MSKHLLPLVSALLLFSPQVEANPVPDAVATRFRNNVLTTAQNRNCPDSASLVADFSSFGLDLLSSNHIKGIEQSFGTFAPLIVASQRPGNRRNISFELQRLYFRQADRNQRAAMFQVLREWLTAEISDAPASGSMWVAAPPDAVRRIIDTARAAAAEVLANEGDTTALPLLAALDRRGLAEPHAAFVLKRSKIRLSTPCAMTFLEETRDGGLKRCGDLSGVRKMSIGRGHIDFHHDEQALDDVQVRELWALIPGVRKAPDSGWIGSGTALVIEFRNGVRASLSPTEPGRLVYADNTTMDYRRRITVQSDSLYDRVRELIRTTVKGSR